MSSIFRTAKFLRNMFSSSRRISPGGHGRRRVTHEERLSLAIAEVLETRVMLSAATHLGFNAQPTDTTAGASISTITVDVLDSGNGVVTSDSSSFVTLAVNTGPGSTSGTLLFAVRANDGEATFSGLALTEAGNYTLKATDGSLIAATSSSFAVTPDVAAQLAISQPGTTVAGATLSTVDVSVEDQWGNVVTSDSSNVTVSLASGSATLGGTLTVGASSGVAAFSDLSLTKAGSYSLGAVDGGLAGATTSNFTISPASANKLVFSAQPADATAGNDLSTVTVSVEDQYNNVVTGDSSNVTIALASGSASLGGTLTEAAASGVATFSDLSLTKSGAYTLGVADGSLTVATSSSFNINAAAASQLAVTQQPTTTVAGADISAVKVSVEDQYGNVVTGDTSNVTIALASGSGSLGGTLTEAAASGVATFGDLSLTKTGAFTVGATDGLLTGATSGSFNITPATASKVVFTAAPGSTTAGALSTVTVSVEDQYGNVVTGDSSNVTVDLASGTGTLLGTLTEAASGGVATFSDLAMHTPGAFTMGAADGSLTVATSGNFTITHAAATKLAVTQQATDTVAGQTISAVLVSVEDQYGNVVTNDGSNVTLALASGSGSLGGTLTVAASSGVATFSDLSLTKAGAFTLGATDGLLTGTTSGSFNITHAGPTQLVMTQGPTDTVAGATISSVLVSVEDQYGNVVTNDSSNVTIALASGTGSLGGTLTEAASSGVATFGDLSITKTGAFTVGVTDGLLTGATSGSFNITPAAANHLAITGAPGSTTAGALSTVTVTVEDQYNNVVTGNSSNVTVDLASGTGTLLGTLTEAASGGVATFSDLAMHTPGAFTMGAADGVLTGDTSGSFTISAAAANKLAFTEEPGSGSAGALGTVQVSVEDQYGNVVTGDSSSVTVGVASGSGALLGTLTATASSGVATFSALAIHTADTYTLSAADGGLTGGTSSSFTVSSAAASKLVFTAQPTSTTAGLALSDMTVAVEDQYGNVVTSSSATVAIGVTGPSNFNINVGAVDGVATLSDIALLKAGSYTLHATKSGLTGATANAFTVTPDVAAQVAITQQTASTTAGSTLTALKATVEDQYGNVETTDSSNVTVSLASGSATLGGTLTVAASSGVATFSDLSLTKVGSYTLGVADASLTTDTSGSFNITPAAASHLVVTQQPTTTTAGGTISSVLVSVEDQYGNVVTGDTSNVTIALASGTGSLTGTLTEAAASGVATFSDLSLTKAGNFTLGATDGSLSSTTSSSFTINPAAASKVVFTTAPTSTSAGLLGTVVVTVEDQYGNVATGNSSNVTVSLASGTGTLLGTLTEAASSGVATFSDLGMHTPGAFTMGAADGLLTVATSGSFTISSAAATHLVVTEQPTATVAGLPISTVTVSVEDQYNNVVTSDSSNVTVALASGTGTLTGTLTEAASSGVATFSDLSLTKVGAFTLGATDGLLTAGTSGSFNITHAAASKLIITQGPTDTVAGGTISNVLVSVEDQYGNVVTNDSSNVTIALASGTGSLSGTLTQAASSGVATFGDLSLTKAGAFTLGVTDASLTVATSGSFNITAAAASKVVFTAAPSSTNAGLLGTVTVSVEDQYNNVVTGNSSNVTVDLASGTGTLLGTLTEAASGGVATFSDLAIHTPNAFTMGAVDGLLTGATSGSFTISPAAATHLVVTEQPTDTVAGQTISTVTVSVEDQYNNVVTSDSSNVTIALASGTGSLTGTLTEAASSGVATFSDLSLTKAGSFTLGATDGLLTTGTSTSFAITAAAVHQVAFTEQPGSGAAGVMGTVQVSVEDQYGNVVTSDSSNVTVNLASGSGTLLGTLTEAASSGVATFSDLAIHASGAFTLGAADGVLNGATSSSFTIDASAATHVVITQGPTDTVAGGTISTVLVSVEDQFNNVVTGNSSNVTIALASGSGTLGGTLTVAASSGVATFSDLSLTKVGAFTVGVTDGLLTGATSGSFNISHATAAQLAVTQQPTDTTAGGTISTVLVSVEDQYGNVVTSNGSNVTIALASGTGSLTGTLTVGASSGVATFSDLSLTKAGAFTLGVTDASLTVATSGSFNITAAAASKVVFTAAPSSTNAGLLGTVTVSVEDQYNNVVTGNSSNVTVDLASGTGTLLGTLTEAASGGVATFSDLAIHTPNAFTMGAVDGLLTGATSGSFTISPAAATHLVVTEQPTDTVAGQTISTVTVSVEDQYNNVVTSDSSNVTIALASGTGSLAGTLTEAASSGVATFSDLSLTKDGAFTLGVTDGSLTVGTSGSFNITHATANKLAVTQGPTDTVAGATVSSVLVSVEDQYGNVVTNDASNVTIALASGTGTLNGTLTQAASSGVATFNDLSITKTGAFTLGVNDGVLTVAASGSFNITPAAANHIVITGEPGSTTAGALSTVTVAVEDQYNNVVTGNSSNVTVNLASGTGTLLGTLTEAASSGVATFSDLAMHTAGTFTIGAADGLLTGDTSSSFTITHAAAAKLAITQGPTTTVAGGTISTVLVSVEDQYGNVVSNDGSNVTIALASGTGTLNGTLTVAAASGVATFSNLSLTKTGSFTLGVTDGSLTTDTSGSFTITPAAANHVAITQQPVSSAAGTTMAAVKVSVEDQYNNVVTTDSTSDVTLSVASGTGTLNGTLTVTVLNGVASFGDLNIQIPGAYTLGAADGVLTPATSNSFNIAASTPTQLVFTETASNTTVGDTLSTISVAVEDQFGNIVVGNSSNVTLKLTTTGSTTFLISAAVDGVATWSGVGLSMAGVYTARATDGGLTAATSGFTLSSDVATQLAIVQQPLDSAAGPLNVVKVAVEDQFGNVVTGDNSNVTMSLASGSGTLLGTLTVAASSGIATFSGLALHTGGTYTLGAADSGLTGTTSSSFNVTAAPANHLVITQEPANHAAGTLGAVEVSVEDQFGNVVTSDSSNVTLALASGTATLGGTLTVAASSGVATFSDLSISKVGAYTLGVADGGLTGATSSSFNVNPAAANKLVITQQPVGTVAGSTLAAVTVTVEDQYGNVVTGDNSNVTVDLASGTATLGGTLTVAASSGVATFSDLSLTKAGSYTLGASDGGLTTATSSSFAITVGTASKLAVTEQPTTTVAGQPISGMQVSVEDQYGNVITTDHSNVTIDLASGSGSLSGTLTVAASNGVATFSGLSLTQAGDITLGATDSGLTGTTSGSFTINPGTATKLVISQDPTDTVAGQPISDVVVLVEDQYGNVVTNDSSNVTISIAGSDTELGGTATVAADEGVAIFDDLSITQTGDYTLSVLDGGLTRDTSGSFAVTPAAANHLAFTEEPGNQAAGSLGTITVSVEDQYDNVVTGNGSNVTIAVASGSGTLSGTLTVAASEGVATFSDLMLTKGDTYTLGATDALLTGATTDSFTIAAAPASQLVITQQTSNATAGQTLNTLTVAVEDQFGNVITTDNSNVTIAVTGNAATLGGTLTVAAADGIATFSGLSLTKAGTYTLALSDGSLAAATSSSLTISAATATKVVFTQQPANGAAGSLGSVIASVEDQYGNVVTTDHSNVTISLASGSATLGGTLTVAASSGVATFSDLSITKSGTYTLGVRDGELSPATSNSFTVSAATATHLVFNSQPSTGGLGALGTLSVSILDQYNNVVTGNSSNVTMALGSGSATLGGTLTVAAVNGVATFTNLTIGTAGVYTLRATDSGLTNATSNSFTVGAKLVFQQQPTSAVAGATISPTITVLVEDANGNVIATDSSALTLAVNTGPSGGNPSGTLTVNAVDGVATFTGLAIHKSGAYTLVATDGTMAHGISTSFTISPAAASQILFLHAPASGTAGVTLAPAVTVELADQYGNVVTTSSANVTLSLTSEPNGGTLLGTTTVALSSGVATFSALSMHVAGNYLLHAVEGGFSVDSGSFTVAPAAASKLVFQAQPSSMTAGGTMSSTVLVEDAFGNVITGNSSNVTLAVKSGTTVVSSLTVAASNGVATFSNFAVQKAGTLTLSATDGSLTAAASSSFAVSTGAAAKVAFTKQPASALAGISVGSMTVAVEDAFGNVITSDNSTVMLAVNSGPEGGALTGTVTAAAVNGVATFSGISLPMAGAYTLSASDNLLTAGTSSSFTITHAAASHLAITQQPTDAAAGAAFSPVVTVKIEDQFGNVATNASSAISVAIATGPTTNSLAGTKTVFATSGVATFSNLNITTSGTYTLRFTSGGFANVFSNSLIISPSASGIPSGSNGQNSKFAWTYVW